MIRKIVLRCLRSLRHRLEARHKQRSSVETLALESNVKIVVRNVETGDVVETRETHNVTTRGFHERLVTAAGPDRAEDTEAVRVAVGDGTEEPDPDDEELDNRVEDVPVTGSALEGNELTISAFMDSTVGNGEDIREIGLLTDDGTLLNRALTETVEKTSSVIVTINVTLSLIDYTEVE